MPCPDPIPRWGCAGVGLLDIPINSLHHRLMAGYTPYPQLGLSGGGSPSPCTHGENHVKIHVKTLLRGSGGGAAKWGGCGVDGGWRRGSRRGWCCLAMGQGLHPMQLVSRWVLSGGFSTVLKNNPSRWGLGLSLGYWWLPIPVPGWDILDHICEASVVTHGALPEVV